MTTVLEAATSDNSTSILVAIGITEGSAIVTEGICRISSVPVTIVLITINFKPGPITTPYLKVKRHPPHPPPHLKTLL